MPVQAQITTTVIQDKQQTRAPQPVGEDHPATMNRMHCTALGCTDHQAIPFQPGIATTLTTVTRLDRPFQRQWQLALGLGKSQAASRGRDTGDGFVNRLYQLLQTGALSLSASQLLTLSTRFTLQASEQTRSS